MKTMFIDSGFLIREEDLPYVPEVHDKVQLSRYGRTDLFIVDDRIFSLDPKPHVKVFLTRISEE